MAWRSRPMRLPLSASALEGRGVVGLHMALRGLAGRIGFDPRPPAPTAAARASATVRVHRPGGVLRHRDRNDAAAADESHRGLQSDQAVHRRGADDAAVGLGADADRGEARGDRGAGAGARAAGIAIEHVRVLRLPAARAPARGRSRGAEVGPLAQVRLAEDHGARRAQARRRGRRPARGGCSRAPASPAEFTMPATSMLSLSSTGMPCSGPRSLPALRSASSCVGVVERLRIQFDHGVQLRARIIDGSRCDRDTPASARAT